MKFHMFPNPWEETIAELTEAGHEEVARDDAEFWVFNGGPDDFPSSVPDGLGFVQAPFAGVEHVMDVIRSSGVRWANGAGLYDNTVAESTLALLLAQLHAHKFVAQSASWSNHQEVEDHTSFLFEDRTVAIVGAGGIGVRLIELLKPFGVRIIAVNRSGRDVPGADEVVTFDDVANVWPRADYFVILAPLTDETYQMVNADVFREMPDHAVVVNVARGGLVDTDALVAALENGDIAGAALDVTDPEPLPDGHPLWADPRVVITPHKANPPYSVRKRVASRAIESAAAFDKDGSLPYEVDVDAGY